MGTETCRARGLARIRSGPGKEHLPTRLDHGHHCYGNAADLCCKIGDLLKLGIVHHRAGAVRGKNREALLLVAISIRGGRPLWPKDVVLAVHDYVHAAFRLECDQAPNAKSKFGASLRNAAQSVCPMAKARLSARATDNLASP